VEGTDSSGQPHRIAILVDSFQGGGIQQVSLHLAAEMQRRGLNVDLVALSENGPLRSSVADEVSVVHLGTVRVRRSILALRRYLRDERPRALLCHHHLVVLAYWSRRLARSPVRIVASRHIMRLPVAPGLMAALRARTATRVDGWHFRRADHVVAVSGAVADDFSDLIGLPREIIDVVANPVVTPAMRERVQAHEQASAGGFWRGRPPVILGVGRLDEKKDFATLIRAMRVVADASEARLRILGEGPYRRELEDLVTKLELEERVQLPGYTQDAFGEMLNARVFVLSSLREAFGLVVVEAMAAGCRVVSTDGPGAPPEILEQGRWGWLVPVRDHEAMGRAILEALVDEHKDARERAAVYSVEAAVDQYLKLLLPEETPAQR
jgi:glycosyltransferase involved in cell wall biosynthesis